MRYRTRAGRSRSRPLALIAAAATAAGMMPLVAPVAQAAITCTVNYQVTNQWQGGFGANVTIKNSGDPVNNWRLTWTFPDGQRVQQGWNGTFTQSGAVVTVAAPSWAPNLGANAEYSVGFNGSWTTQNRAPEDFAINGTRCTGPNVAPTVSLTSPTAGQAFQSGQAVPLAATATDTDGTVSKVDFLADGVVVATDTSSPFTGSWTGATVGEHTITARATDNKGGIGNSSPVGIRVLAGQAIQISPPTLNVRQGGTATFAVSLATAPTSSVTVNIGRTAGSTDLTASPTSLTFTTTNWSTKQNVTVTSADNGGDLASATFTASATGVTSATATVTEIAKGSSDFTQAFLDQYNKIHDPASGYFRTFSDGLKVPYHSVETLMVEAPDHGHQTTSEAFSYYLWLEASYGRITGNWASFKSAWASMEKYIIPATADQPTNDKYNASKPATYAPEHPRMDLYPSQLDSNISVGSDPIAGELKSAYGTPDIYGMHWLMDVDNTYGFGRCGDGTNTAPAYINTYQRGSSESVWETVPQPSCDTFKHGGPNGFLDLFTKDSSYAKQWKYTNAPDADARAVQVALLAQQWA
ncbi:MAG: cellulose 1,4-beta-cellobiosidase, partial [Saccharothrix sp.]|nr:cellulose 1,4-beta-cellobiosidase [Saccharothrix sp.]